MSCGAWGYAVFPPSVRRSSIPLRLCFILDLRCLISCECLSPRRRRSIFISPLKSVTANVAEDQIFSLPMLNWHLLQLLPLATGSRIPREFQLCEAHCLMFSIAKV